MPETQILKLCQLGSMANGASLEQNQNHCSSINSSSPMMQGHLPTLTLSGKIRVTLTFFLFLLSTTFNASFLLKLKKWTQKKGKGKKLSRMKVLLKHLTLANLLETLIVMPLDGMWNITVQWYGGELLCKVLSYLKLFSMYAPAFMMVVISLDRSMAITRPLAVSNSRLGQSLIGLAWLFSSLFAGPQVNHHRELVSLWQSQISYLNLSVVLLCITFGIALLLCLGSGHLRVGFNPGTVTATNLLASLGPSSFIYKIEVILTLCSCCDD